MDPSRGGLKESEPQTDLKTRESEENVLRIRARETALTSMWPKSRRKNAIVHRNRHHVVVDDIEVTGNSNLIIVSKLFFVDWYSKYQILRLT